MGSPLNIAMQQILSRLTIAPAIATHLWSDADNEAHVELATGLRCSLIGYGAADQDGLYVAGVLKGIAIEEHYVGVFARGERA